MKAKRPRPKVPEKADDEAQSERFIESAREHGGDAQTKSFSEALKKIAKNRKSPRRA